MSERFFIGYGILEELLATHPPDAPLYLSMGEDPGEPTKYGMSLNRFVLMASDTKDGQARYCRLQLDSVQMLAGQPLDRAQYDKARQRALGAYDLVKEHITTGYSFRVENAMISMPLTLKLIKGWASFLTYDKQADRFIRRHDDEQAA